MKSKMDEICCHMLWLYILINRGRFYFAHSNEKMSVVRMLNGHLSDRQDVSLYLCFCARTWLNWITTWLTLARWDTIKTITVWHLNPIGRTWDQSYFLLSNALMQDGICLRWKECEMYNWACSLDSNQTSLAIRSNYKEADFPFGFESLWCLLTPPHLTPLPSVALQAAGSRLVGGFCSHLAA